MKNNTIRMSITDAKTWSRADCDYCQKVLARAQKLGRDVMVNTYTRDALKIAPSRIA